MKCCLCGKSCAAGSPLCKKCMEGIDELKISDPHCPVCAQALWNDLRICPECREKEGIISDVRSLFLYRGNVRRIIHLFKFEGIYSLSHYFADKLYHSIKLYYPDHVIQVIPPRKGKIYKNGWDQMKLIAQCLPLPQVKYLSREKGISQKSLNRIDRSNKIKGQFICKRIRNIESPILILDDIRTTGSTLHEAARSLKQRGADRISALTIALD